MLYFQKWENNSFEYKYLNEIRKTVSDKKDKKIYFGFDYGFFNGTNIYYGTKKEKDLANKVYNLFNKTKLNIRLFTNIDYDYDLIILFAYSNNKKERKYLIKKKKKILKALSLI